MRQAHSGICLRTLCTKQPFSFWLQTTALLLILTGCAEKSPPVTPSPAPAAGQDSRTESSAQETSRSTPDLAMPTEEPLPDLPIITFGNSSAGSSAMSPSATDTPPSAEETRAAETVIGKLKELQILLGTWRGITQKEFGNFKGVDETQWLWDFKTNRKQPALQMASAESPYYRQARLTYLPETDQFQLTVTDPEQKTTQYAGTYTQAIEIEQGDNGKPQQTYKLELTQQNASEGEAMRFVLNQQDNNRYLLEIYRQRKGNDRFIRIDTVSTQREGTSLAMSDEDYGEKTCIISGGLGTISVSYQGQTYYVCCTGCKAAFEDDPARWIARAKEQKK